MEDDSDLIKSFAYFIACAIVAIGYFYRPYDTSIYYYLKLSFAAVAVASFGVMLAALDEYRTQQRRDKRASKILVQLKDDPSKVKMDFIIYLRPFFTTGNMPVEQARGGAGAIIPLLPGYFKDRVDSRAVELEKTIAKALAPSGLLIGLGKPGEQIGAGRITSDNAHWQSEVRLLVKYAKFLILLPSERPGTNWEICLARDECYLDKCAFLMPPKLYFSSIEIENIWEKTRQLLQLKGFELPMYQTDGMLFSLTPEGKMSKKLALPLDSGEDLKNSFSRLLNI